MERIVLATPRGFCAGVSYAVGIVKRALDAFGTPLYVRHAIVHNEKVVAEFERQGVRFVEELEEVPNGQVVVFSAHGVSPAVRAEAEERGLKVVDATCPLVDKVHREARDWAERGYTILYIGHSGHAEAVGTMGEAPAQTILVDGLNHARTVTVPDPEHVVVLTQTTLSVDEVNTILAVLRERFPALSTPRKEDICYATTNRQDAVKLLTEQCDLIVVVGSPSSSNSSRLQEVAASRGADAYLVRGVEDMREEWLAGHTVVGVTSGASTPEAATRGVVAWLQDKTGASVEYLEAEEERIRFKQPSELLAASRGK